MPPTGSEVPGASGAGDSPDGGSVATSGDAEREPCRSARPTHPTATAPTASEPDSTRNRRRSQSGILAAGGSAVTGGPAAEMSVRSVQIEAPTASPTVRIDSGTVLSPSRSEAYRATTPNTANATAALMKLVRATSPSNPPIISAAIRMRTLRASLSFVPNNDTTRSLAPGGCRSMTRLPTAITRDGAPPTRPARISPTAMATATATAPATKYGQRCGEGSDRTTRRRGSS